MAQENMKMTRLGDSDADEAMRRVRKNVVASLLNKNPRASATTWTRDKDGAVRIED